jgi:hypothetical protein
MGLAKEIHSARGLPVTGSDVTEFLRDGKKIVSPNASPEAVFPSEPTPGKRLCIAFRAPFVGNEVGRHFLVNGITVNKIPQTVESAPVLGAFPWRFFSYSALTRGGVAAGAAADLPLSPPILLVIREA